MANANPVSMSPIETAPRDTAPRKVAPKTTKAPVYPLVDRRVERGRAVEIRRLADGTVMEIR